MKLLEVSSLIDLATSHYGTHSNIQLSSRYLLKSLGEVNMLVMLATDPEPQLSPSFWQFVSGCLS